MKTLLSNRLKGRYIIKTMVIKDLKARYAGSVFGPFWLIATPIYQIFFYSFIFSMILKVRFEEGAGTLSFSGSPMEEVQNRQERLQKYKGGGSVETGHLHFGENRTFLFWLDKIIIFS